MSCTPGNGTGLRLMTGSNSEMIKIEQSAFICRSCDFLYCLWSDLEKLWSGHRRSMVDIEDRRSISSSTVRLWATIFAYPPPSRILSTLALHRTASYTDKCEVTKWMLPMKNWVWHMCNVSLSSASLVSLAGLTLFRYRAHVSSI